jgi:hypothetical protein
MLPTPSQVFAEELRNLRDCTPPVLDFPRTTPSPAIDSQTGINPTLDQKQPDQRLADRMANPTRPPLLPTPSTLTVNLQNPPLLEGRQSCPFCKDRFNQLQHVADAVSRDLLVAFPNLREIQGIRLPCFDKHVEERYQMEIGWGTCETSTATEPCTSSAPPPRY